MVRVPTAAALAGAVPPQEHRGWTLAAALGALDVVVELQAAMIAGMETRPAAPAMPLRTVRRETESTRMGSAMVMYSSSDAARQNPTGSTELSLPTGSHVKDL